VVEQGLQTLTDISPDPFGVEIDADASMRRLGPRDGLELPQHAVAVIGQRTREQLPLGVERNFVGPLGRAEHRDHHAQNRDRDRDADRHHDAQARMARRGRVAGGGDIGRSQDQVSFPQGLFALGE
jgi:hypothetical protein